MKILKVTKENEQYYSLDFVRGYNIGAKQQAEIMPERKKGSWELLNNGDAICSECGRRQKSVWDFDNWDNFCRHCGADMRGNE